MQFFTTMVPTTAVLLVGGKGTRLKPITDKIPKALIEINGKTITEHLIDLLKEYGVNNIILSVGYLKEKIIDYFGNGQKFDIKITYVKEDRPLGTAGPLILAKKYLKESFIVSNGDELKVIDIEDICNVHKKNNALATIALTKVNDPSHYGVAELNGSHIVRFVEKPKKDEAPSNLINAGFYIIEPKVIDLIKPGFCMLEKDVFPKLAEQGKLLGYHFNGQWFDIGTLERYERAKKEWKGVS